LYLVHLSFAFWFAFLLCGRCNIYVLEFGKGEELEAGRIFLAVTLLPSMRRTHLSHTRYFYTTGSDDDEEDELTEIGRKEPSVATN
jgi:hypothetical protein